MPFPTLLAAPGRWRAAPGFLPALAAVFLGAMPSSGQTAIQAAVQVTAQVAASPPAITFSWPADATATGYTVVRRAPGAAFWGPNTAIPGGGAATSWTDTNVVAGARYEYWFSRSGNLAARGFITSGIEAAAVEFRGKIILLVDATKAVALASRIDRLVQDLAGDGWIVIRHNVQPTLSVPSVKALITADYVTDPANVKSVFILGRIPVAYSGALAPDGHPDHQGAWAADVYYGEMNGFWTDTSINITTASRPENRNIPGDGKFDQSAIPTDVEVGVGRVDFANMPAFGASEETLLANYLDKDHDYRHQVFSVDQRAVIDDNFGWFGGEAFAATGWRNFTALFGAANVTAGDYFTTLNTSSGGGWSWSYGCGGGSYTSAGGIGNTTSFTTSTNRGVFTILFGSYFGDWDSTNNFLRAPLCSGWTLTDFWAGRPHWSFHQMAMGETIGACARSSQNDTSAGGSATRFVHIALMGDPTLRQHVIAPPIGALASPVGSQVAVTWGPSADAVAGYHVYRAATAAGPFTRLTPAPVPGVSFTDPTPLNGPGTYLVRALRLEASASGTYWNLSQGAFAPACAQNPAVAQSVGAACGPFPPLLSATPPAIGQNLVLSLAGGESGAPGQLFGGTLGAPTSLGGGCEVQLDIPSALLFTAFTLDAAGAWSFSLPVPNDPALICLTADLQAIVLGPTGFSLSNALHLVAGT